MIDLLAPSAAAIGLSICRFAGFAIVSPLPGPGTPASARVGLVVVLGLVTGLSRPVPVDARLTMCVAAEIGIGLMIGFVLRLALLSADAIGAALAQATGLGIASVLDPHQQTTETPAARVVSLFALAVVVSVGGHRVALAYLLESFRALPVGSTTRLEGGALPLVAMGGEALTLGVRLSMPIAGAALALQAALALVARTAPALQLFNMGIAILICAGFGALLASAPDMAAAIGAFASATPDRLDRILLELTP